MKQRNYHIANMVYSFSLGHRIILEKIATETDCEYNPEIFPGLRFTDGGVIQLFSSGKGTITAVKTKKEAETVLKKFLGKIGYRVKMPSLKLINMSIASKFKDVDFSNIIQNQNIMYDPESGPHAILKKIIPIKFTALIAKNGHVYILGLKDENLINSVIDIISEELRRI